MSVSSKWYVSHIDGNTVHLLPVCRGVENRQWAQATPAGSMQMLIQNPAALEQFRQGEEYEAVFAHKAKPAPHDGHALDVVEVRDQWNPKTGQNDRTYYVCGTCGSYASLGADEVPDWSAHEAMFSRPE